MKTRIPLGLVVEGNSSKSEILRLPSLAEDLGPVKSATHGVARRMSNFLRAGYPVDSCEQLEAARLILIRVPDSSVHRIVEEICNAEVCHRELSFLLCETWLTSDVLEPLAKRGATIATLTTNLKGRELCFAIEGQLAAVRKTKRFLGRNDIRLIEIRQECKPLYFAAALLATALPIPLYFEAQNALRSSGISGNQLHDVEQDMVERMFRTFAGGSRRAWGGPLTECSAETAERHLAHLRSQDPALAETLDQQLAWAKNKMQRRKASSNSRKDGPAPEGGPMHLAHSV